MYFEYLRKIPWKPTFVWVESSIEAAIRINTPHEDYPKYVEATNTALRDFKTSKAMSNRYLKLIHRHIFADKPFAGKWRGIDVRVGIHFPPRALAVPGLMNNLEQLYSITSVNDLLEWYKDFETIHPFQDGNGRVGGVVVAAYAQKLHPEKGWLAPNQ